MNEITKILREVESGAASASSDLMPLVYDELRRLAEAKLAHERPDHTLQATALVHEAWLRLVGNDLNDEKNWSSRNHFFGAAAEAMRRILIDHARATQTQKRGGDRKQIQLESWNHPAASQPEKLIELDEALEKLEQNDELKAALVKLRFFAGFTNKEAADALGISTATAERYWAYARAWLHTEMQ